MFKRTLLVVFVACLSGFAFSTAVHAWELPEIIPPDDAAMVYAGESIALQKAGDFIAAFTDLDEAKDPERYQEVLAELARIFAIEHGARSGEETTAVEVIRAAEARAFGVAWLVHEGDCDVETLAKKFANFGKLRAREIMNEWAEELNAFFEENHAQLENLEDLKTIELKFSASYERGQNLVRASWLDHWPEKITIEVPYSLSRCGRGINLVKTQLLELREPPKKSWWKRLLKR